MIANTYSGSFPHSLLLAPEIKRLGSVKLLVLTVSIPTLVSVLQHGLCFPLLPRRGFRHPPAPLGRHTRAGRRLWRHGGAGAVGRRSPGPLRQLGLRIAVVFQDPLNLRNFGGA